MRSSLAPLAHASREPDPAEGRRLAQEAWHTHGLVLLRQEWFAGWADWKQAELLAEKLFGRRGS